MQTPRTVLSLSLVIACLGATVNSQLTVAQTSKDAPVASIPDTAAGRQMTGWFKAFNSGDPKLIRAFHAASGAGERVDRRGSTGCAVFQPGAWIGASQNRAIHG